MELNYTKLQTERQKKSGWQWKRLLDMWDRNGATRGPNFC